MKKIFFITALYLVFFGVHAPNLWSQNSASQSGIDISFTYNRLSGSASNQYAVWIEDNRGNLIRTLFATRYTASGGWQRRPNSIPLWVKQSGLSSLNKAEVDVFTGATPRTGAVSYRWDGTDKNGRQATAGEYRVFLEATLRNENKVLYSAPFTLGSSTAAEATVRTEYFGNDTRDRNMIENVRVLYRP
jgi:hypothetical protein